MLRITPVLSGIMLLITSMIYLLTLLFTAPAPDATGFLTAVLCDSDEIMTHQLGEPLERGFFKNNQLPTHLFCQNRAGELREVTGQAFFVVMGGFVLLFLSGLFTLIFGIFRLMHARLRNSGVIYPVKSNGGSVYYSRD